jgi:hypothetical protein
MKNLSLYACVKSEHLREIKAAVGGSHDILLDIYTYVQCLFS